MEPTAMNDRKRPKMIDRRRIIQGIGAAGLAGAAGCLGGDGDGNGNGNDGNGDGGNGNENSDDEEVDRVDDPDEFTNVITFWELFSGGEGDAMEEIVDSYNEAQSEVGVNRQRIPWGAHYDRLFTAMTGGDAPELAIMHDWAVGEFSERLEPLDSVSSDPYLSNPWEAGAFDGTQYAIPLDTHPYGMYYNKDMFEEADLDPDDPPTNWDEFVEVCDAIVDNTGNRAVATGTPWPIFYAVFKQYDGELLAEDHSEIAFDSEAGVKAAEFIYEIPNRGWDAEDEISGDNEFRGGDAAMNFTGTWFLPVVQELDFDWGMFNPSVAPDKVQDATLAGSHMLSVPLADLRGDSSDEATEAAIQAAEWISTEGALTWGSQAGHLPAHSETNESEELRGGEGWEEMQSVFYEMSEQDQLEIVPATSFGDRFLDPIKENLAEVASLRMEPEEAISDAAERGNQIIQQDS